MSTNIKRSHSIRLKDDEREALEATVNRIVGGWRVVASCAYGSRVAGYAKSDSDYDVIVVLESYRPKIRYRYVKYEADVSALLVDSQSFIHDAERSSLGEFVAGRLLNIYEPLTGADFLREAERVYKKRVILETLGELVSAYKEFSSQLIIPIEYFLFEKLKKRAGVYPPALYSYVKTYSGERRDLNIAASIPGFVDALKELMQEGLVQVEDGYVRIHGSTLRGERFARLTAVLHDTATGIAQYAVHGYAGRVGLKVIGKEALSKLVRQREIGEIPEEIKHPKNLLNIEEGLLLVECDDWLRSVAEYLGLQNGVSIRQRHIGELYNISNIYLLDDGSRVEQVAVKKFRDVRSFKWALLNIWALPTKRFNVSPLARMAREYCTIRALRKLGLNTPEIVAVALNDRILITRYVDGVDLGTLVHDILEDRCSDFTPIQLYGKALARAHSSNYAIGDTKPSNAIYADGKIFLTDLEQAVEGGDKAWDIAEFVYYSTKLTLNLDRAVGLVKSFLEGYLTHGSVRDVKKALDMRYLAPFQPFMAPNVALNVRSEMSRLAKS